MAMLRERVAPLPAKELKAQYACVRDVDLQQGEGLNPLDQKRCRTSEDESYSRT